MSIFRTVQRFLLILNCEDDFGLMMGREAVIYCKRDCNTMPVDDGSDDATASNETFTKPHIGC